MPNDVTRNGHAADTSVCSLLPRQTWYQRLQVSASSPVCRNTDPKAVVSGNFLRMNFAGPCTVDGKAQTWWKVDLGRQHCLTCNYYTLRQDGSQDFLRNWVMQVRFCAVLYCPPSCRHCQHACMLVLGGRPFAVHSASFMALVHSN